MALQRAIEDAKECVMFFPEPLGHFRATVVEYDRAAAADLESVTFGDEHIEKTHVETARQHLASATND